MARALEPAWPRLVATSGDAWIWLADLDAADASGARARPAVRRRAGPGRRASSSTSTAAGSWPAAPALRTLLGERLGLLGPGRCASSTGRRASRRWPAAPACASTCRTPIATRSWRWPTAPRSAWTSSASGRFATWTRWRSGSSRRPSARRWRGVPADRKAEAFFAGWTRKEAYIKARGEGIGLLGAIEVALTPGDAAPAHPGGGAARRAGTLVD